MSHRPIRRPVLPASPFNVTVAPPPVERFAIDDRLTHDRHGLGRVIKVEGDNMVLVDFGSEVRRLVFPNAKVTKL